MKPLISYDDNLAAGTYWNNDGYTFAVLFDKADSYYSLVSIFEEIIKSKLIASSYFINNHFVLNQYHKIIQSDEQHYSFIAKMGNFFPAHLLGDLLDEIEDRVSAICQKKVHAKHPDYDEKIFNIRIVRPNSKDNNPLHRDVWLDRLRNGINIYVPITGSNELSSLPIIPKSHYWAENELERTEKGAEVEGRAYTVPSVIKINKDHEIIRPNPKDNEVMVFSPYLIHGGASNLNENITRVSLEMRFWRK